MRGNQRTRKGGTAPPSPVDGQDRKQAGDVTDAKGKGLAPVWRGGCLGRDPDPAKADGPMKSQTPATGRGDLHRRHSPPPFFPRSRSGSPARPAAVQGAKRGEADPFDGEDRAITMHYEGKRENLKPWEKGESETAGLCSPPRSESV